MEQATVADRPTAPAPQAAATNGALSASSSDHLAVQAPRSAAPLVVELDSHERAQAADAIDGQLLAAVAAGDLRPGTPEFFDAAEILEGALPDQARAAISALRHGLVPAIVIRGLPYDEDPGATPAHAGVVPPSPPRANAWIAMAVRRLGHEFAYASEKKGALVHNIHPTAEGAKTQSNASFTIDLSLHTENAFHPIRPDFVTLFCIRTAADTPATRLVMLDDVLSQLTDAEIAVLRQERFTIRVVDSHKAEGEADIELPVTPLTGSPRRPQIRWHETLRASDAAAARVCRSFAEATKKATQYVKLEPGDQLAFANHVVLHGRDSFDAKLDGTDRWLLRGFALRDLTPTEPYVAPARPRVTRVDLSTHPGA